MESIEFGALISKSASRSREKLHKRGRNKHSNNICTYKTTVNVQKTISSRCILEIEEEEKKTKTTDSKQRYTQSNANQLVVV